MYVDAYLNKGKDIEIIRVAERVDGKRVYKEYPPDYHYYISDPRGSHKTIYGNTVKKVIPKSHIERSKQLKSTSGNVHTWEADVDPVFRCFEQHYQRMDPPTLNVAFLDIETAFDEESGWSLAADASNAITAISIHLQWIDELVCLAIPPDTISFSEAEEIAQKVGNVILFDDEGKLLDAFLDIIEDADILSGWNSLFYDIPYIINRIKKKLGKHETRRLCLWDLPPKPKEIDRGGKIEHSYELIGRVHLDYLDLYKKYNYEERHSYKLNSIAEIELKETKVEFDGTLDELYCDNFQKFLEYNIQDTRLLDRLDKKLQFIGLANSIAHANCVPLPSTMGTVSQTDQAVLIEAHSKGLICPNRKHSKSETDNRAAGGWVSTPKSGLHRWIASTDMKSLYPSVIRALNISPETIIGQIDLSRTNAEIAAWEKKGSKYTFANWWNDRFNVLEMERYYEDDIEEKLTLKLENGDVFNITGKELKQLVLSQQWCISANGTIFRTDIDGIIPSLLTRWYNERKALQARNTFFTEIIEEGITLPEEIAEMF